MKLLRDLTLLITTAASLSVASYFFHPHRPELFQSEEKAGEGEITVKDAKMLTAAGQVLWLDARKRTEHDKGHVPQAMLLNTYEWDTLMIPAMEALNTAMEKQQKVIIYCDAMKCTASKEMAKKVSEFFPEPENVLILRGGWPAWQGAK